MNLMAIDRRAHPAGAEFSVWQAPDGWSLRRMRWPQPHGFTPRGSLFFAGGRRDFIEKYLEAMGHLHGRGWNVDSFDWRGPGEWKSVGEGKSGEVREGIGGGRRIKK